MERGGSVYILTNKYNTVLYIGVTAFLAERINEHRDGIDKRSFSFRYNLYKLVYFEDFHSIEEAINREKQLKKYSRAKKNYLIEKMNPAWEDLYDKLEGY